MQKRVWGSRETRARWSLLGLALLAAGCTDPEVGSIKLKDESEKNPPASKTEGRFKENAPTAKPTKAQAKEGGREAGIESR